MPVVVGLIIGSVLSGHTAHHGQRIVSNHHAVTFLADTIEVLLTGAVEDHRLRRVRSSQHRARVPAQLRRARGTHPAPAGGKPTMMGGSAKIIVAKTKRVKGGAHHGPSWKVASADLVTAMTAFFLIMWIMGMDQGVKGLVQGYFANPVGIRQSFSRGTNPISAGSSPVDVELRTTTRRRGATPDAVRRTRTVRGRPATPRTPSRPAGTPWTVASFFDILRG